MRSAASTVARRWAITTAVRRCSVHHQHIRVPDRHAGHSQQLTFTGAEIASALAQLGVQPLRQTFEQPAQAKITADIVKVLIINLAIEAQVVGNAAAEQKRVLKNDPELTAQIGK